MEPLKKGDGNSSVPGSLEGRAGLNRMVPAVATHPLIAPGKGSRKKDPIPENSGGLWVRENFQTFLFPMDMLKIPAMCVSLSPLFQPWDAHQLLVLFHASSLAFKKEAT